MRLTRLITACMFMVLLASCSAADSSTEIAGIPTFETPVGLFPDRVENTPDPLPVMKPVSKGAVQRINTPEIGVRLDIPEEWSIKANTNPSIIVDANGDSMIEVGQAYGFTPDTDVLAEELRTHLHNIGFSKDDFTINESTVNVYSYVVVSGTRIDACQYNYLPVDLSTIVLKFERLLCDSDGRLNDTAFAVLRSVTYTGPLR